jgi:hypothetical protein
MERTYYKATSNESKSFIKHSYFNEPAFSRDEIKRNEMGFNNNKPIVYIFKFS